MHLGNHDGRAGHAPVLAGPDVPTKFLEHVAARRRRLLAFDRRRHSLSSVWSSGPGADRAGTYIRPSRNPAAADAGGYDSVMPELM